MCSHDYPEIHRLLDFIVDGKSYRVCRCVTCGEKLFIFTIPEADIDTPGVPFDLSGEALHRWVRDEKAAEEDEDDDENRSLYTPGDWSRYLS